MWNITLRHLLLSAITLCTACSHTQRPDEHMLGQAKQDKIYAKEWKKGNSMVQKGHHMVKKGQKNIVQGNAQIQKGNLKISEGSKKMRDCEMSFMNNLMEDNTHAHKAS